MGPCLRCTQTASPDNDGCSDVMSPIETTPRAVLRSPVTVNTLCRSVLHSRPGEVNRVHICSMMQDSDGDGNDNIRVMCPADHA